MHTWRDQLGYHLTTVGDEHGFTGCRRAHVLAETVLQGPYADAVHAINVATRGYIVNAGDSAACRMFKLRGFDLNAPTLLRPVKRGRVISALCAALGEPG